MSKMESGLIKGSLKKDLNSRSLIMNVYYEF